VGVLVEGDEEVSLRGVWPDRGRGLYYCYRSRSTDPGQLLDVEGVGLPRSAGGLRTVEAAVGLVSCFPTESGEDQGLYHVARVEELCSRVICKARSLDQLVCQITDQERALLSFL
jgi:hypothetical protein